MAMQDSQLVVVDSRFENCGKWGYTNVRTPCICNCGRF